jgi:16S rRNA processing protein RimM
MKRDHDIELGVVGAGHGLHGEVVVHLHNPDSELLVAGCTIRLAMPSGPAKILKVAATRTAGKGRVVAFEGFDDRTAAETLRGARLMVRRDELPPAGEGEFYYDDLPGMVVRLTDGTEIGRVTAVFRGATDILILDLKGRELLVPCVAGFVAEVGAEAVVIEPAALEEPD